MRFGSAIKAVAAAAVERATAKRMRFLEIVTSNEIYSPAPAKTQELLKLYNENLWVRSIVGKIAKVGANRKWYLEDAAGKRIDKHPALDWLRTGTPKLPARLALQVTLIHLDLAGEAFWAVGRDAKGRLSGYAPIPPHWVTNIPDLDDPGEVYEIQPKSDGMLYRIPADQIIHFRDPDALDPYGRGSSHARAAKVELDTDANASKYLAAFFKNNARPDLIVSGSKEAPMSNVDKARAEEMWTGRFRGVSNAFKPFFSSQPLQITPLGASLKDNAVADLKPALASTVAEFYGVPPEILGRLENSNRATIDAADHLLGKFVLDPRLSLVREVLEPELAGAFTLEGLTLCYETPIHEDRAFNLTVMTAKPSAFTPNEFRELAGKRRREDAGFDDPIAEPVMDPNAPGNDNGPGGSPPPKGGKTPPKADNTKTDASKAVDSPAPERKSLSPEDIIRVADAHSDPQVTAEASRLMDEIFLKLLATYGEELLSVLEADANFAVSGATAEWLIGRGSALISGVDATTRNALRAALVEGAAANETVSALAQRVDQIFEEAAKIRSPIIGRTEATAIAGFGSQEAARQGGFEAKKWLTTGDQVVRNSHREMDGQTRRTAEPFISPSGNSAMHPGDFGVAAEDINCRCAMRPVLAGELERAAGITDKAFEAAWLGMHGRTADAIANRMSDIFAAQREVVIAALNRTIGGSAAHA